MGYFGWFNSRPAAVSNTATKTAIKAEHFLTTLKTTVAHAATDLAYKIAKGKVVYEEHELKTNNSLGKDGWKVLCKSSEFNDTDQNGYKAVTFVNENTKQVLIATAGTVPTDIHDIKDDLYLFAGSFPSKVVQAKAMIDHTVDLLGTDARDYTFNATGHSLGAVLTDVTAFDVMSRGLKLGTSVTFDSPGSINAIDQAVKAGVFDNTVNVAMSDLAEHCVVYNAKHNAVNYNPVISSPHITEPKLVLPLEQATASLSTQDTVETSGIVGYASYLVSKVSSSITKTCSDYLGITKVLTEVENLKGHSLVNFADLCEKPVIDTLGWEKSPGGSLLIKDFAGCDHLSSTGEDTRVIKEQENDDTVIITCKDFSFADLQRMHEYNTGGVILSGENLDLDFDIIN